MAFTTKTALLSAMVLGLSLATAPAFAQGATGAQGAPGGAGTGGASGTGAPLTSGGAMEKSDSMSKGSMSSPAAPAGSTSTENKPTASGGQPGGDATRGR